MSITKRAFAYVHNNRIYALAFAIPSIVMLVIFAMAGVYPFGNRSFLHIDMYHQYFPFLTDMYHAVRGGSDRAIGSGILYSFNAGLGTNFTALFDYYLSSPFNLLAFLVPEKYLMEFFSYLAIIKIGMAGSMFCFYLSKHFDIDVSCGDIHILLIAFSLFYSLSGYMAAYNWDLMWLDVVALSPIVILGLERLCDSDGKRCMLYTVSLAAALICNYYLCIMLCIYIVLYYLIVLIPERIYDLKHHVSDVFAAVDEVPEDRDRHIYVQIFKNLGIFAGSSILAASLAGVVLIPSAMSVMMTGFADSTFPGSYRAYFTLFELTARHLMDVAVETGLDHWPNIYSSVSVLILLPLYIICGRIPLRKKIGRLILLLFMLYSFSVNILSYLWHGLNYPDSLPARQSYLYIFLLLTVCFEVLLNISVIRRRTFLATVLIAMLFLTLIQRCVHVEAVSERTVALSAAFMTAYAAMLWLYKGECMCRRNEADAAYASETHKKTVAGRRVIAYVILAAAILESGINMRLTSVPTVSRSAYLKGFGDYEHLYAKYNELNMTHASYDGSNATNTGTVEGAGLFYRFERENRQTNNDAMLKAYPSISMFSSIGNGRINDFYKRYGMRSSKVFYCADGATPFIRALLGNKYVFVEDKDRELWEAMHMSADISDSLTVKRTDGSGEVGLYEYEGSLPVGYMIYTSDIDEDRIIGESGNKREKAGSDDLDPIERQNELAYALGASGDMYIFAQEFFKEEQADFDVTEDGYYYAFCDTKKIDTLNVSLHAGDKEYKKLKNPYIIELGHLNNKDEVHMDQGDAKSPASLKMKIYRLDTEVYDGLMGSLSSDVFALTKDGFGPGRLKGQIQASHAGYMILSIPYDEGFSVYVDGLRVKALPAMGMMTAVPLNTGRHLIELKYVPKGLLPGAILTLISILLLVFFNKYLMDGDRM